MRFNTFLILIFFTINALSAGTYFKPPALIEGFTTVASAAGTTTLTRASETKLIITGATTQTVVLPDATTMSTELGRRFYIINKSSGNVTVNASGGGLLTTLSTGTQAEIHLRAAGSAAGTWDVLSSSGGGGGTWGSITGTLSAQTDLQSALDLKAPLASPTFSGTITTPLTANRALVTGASGVLSASAVTATQLGYLGTATSDLQVQLDAKQARSTLTTAGDIYVATASATTTRLGPPAIDGRQLISDSAATNKIRYQAPLVDNFIKNGDAESTNIWTAYADAAGTRPVDCTGGSPNVTTSTTSSSPLADVNSFTFVKDAANRQGQGWSVPFTIPASQQAKVLQIEIPYIVSSGTFVAGTSSTDSDVIWYIYDVTNSQLIEPSSIKMLSNSTTISDRLVANFQTSATGTSYRLCAHVATTSASAYTLKTDDDVVKPSSYVYGTPITDWVAYTPTGSWVSGATYTGRYRRVGDTLDGMVLITATGAVTAANLTFTIPSGLSIDTAKIMSTTQDVTHLGTVKVLDSGVAAYGIGTIHYNSSNSLAAYTSNTSGTYLTEPNISNSVPMTFGSADTVDARFSVPISGWSSSVQQSDGYESRKVIFEARTNGGSIATSAATYVTLTWTTPTIDFVAGWNGSDTYTIRTADCYDIQVLATQNANAAAYLDVAYRINGGSEVLIGRGFGSGTASGVVTGTATTCLNAGDTVQARAQTEGTQGIGGLRRFTIKRSGGGTPTMSATELVAASRTAPSATITGTYSDQTWATLTDDTHGAMGTVSFTAPVSGRYVFVAQNLIQYTSASGNQNVKLRLLKNGATEIKWFGFFAPAAVTSFFTTLTVDSGEIQLNAGDTVKAQLSTTMSSASISADNAINYFSVHMIK